MKKLLLSLALTSTLSSQLVAQSQDPKNPIPEQPEPTKPEPEPSQQSHLDYSQYTQCINDLRGNQAKYKKFKAFLDSFVTIQDALLEKFDEAYFFMGLDYSNGVMQRMGCAVANDKMTTTEINQVKTKITAMYDSGSVELLNGLKEIFENLP